MNKNYILPIGRASYISVLNPKADAKGTLKYSTDILWSKDTDLSGLKAVLEKAAKEKWGAKAPKNVTSFIKDGGGVRPKTGEPYAPEYHGHYFITIKIKRRPGVVDSQMQPIINDSDPYGGCYIRARVLPYAYEIDNSKGVTLYLQNIQKVKDGEPFGAARTSIDQEFDVVDEESDNPANYKSSSLLG